jgi:hypothetical protein
MSGCSHDVHEMNGRNARGRYFDLTAGGPVERWEFCPSATQDANAAEHFPWSYTEAGVICACGASMRDEVCPQAAAPEAKS